MNILLSVLATICIGVLGSAFQYDNSWNVPELGSILAIAVMGGCILFEIKSKKK